MEHTQRDREVKMTNDNNDNNKSGMLPSTIVYGFGANQKHFFLHKSYNKLIET